MTRDDIIRMAREAGFDTDLPVFKDGSAIALKLADLVADAERNECAALVDANAMACHSPIYRSLLQSNADAIRARGKK